MQLRIDINGLDMTEYCLLDSFAMNRAMAPTVGTVSVSLVIDQRLQPKYNFAFFDQANYALELNTLDQITVRDADTGDVRFVGLVTKVAFKVLSPSETIWSLDCQDLSILLDTTIINQAFTNSSDQSIIRAVFASALPDLDTSDVEMGIPVIANYEAKDCSLQKVLTDMTDLSGGVWHIDPTKHLHYHVDDVVDAPFGISDNPDNVTTFDEQITAFSRNYSGRANRITLLAGTDATTQTDISVTVEDVVHQQRYGRIYALTFVDRNITSRDVAQMRARAELIRRTHPTETGTAIVRRDGLDVGQMLYISSTGFQVFGKYLIRSISAKQITPDETEYTVQFGDNIPTLVSLLASIKRASARPTPASVPDKSITGSKVADRTLTGDNIALATIRAENIDTVSVDSLVGNLDISRVDNLGSIDIGTFTGNWDASRITNLQAVNIGNFGGALDVSHISNLGTFNIGNFEGVITTDQVAAGFLDDLSKFAADFRPVTKVPSLPALPDPAYPVDTVVLCLADSRLYRNVNDTLPWQTVSASDTITGKISNGDILEIEANKIVGQINAAVVNHIAVSEFAGTLSVAQCNQLDLANFAGKLDVSKVDRINTINIGTLTGNLDASRVSNLNSVNINTFTGTIGTINATTVNLLGQWQDSQIGSISVSKLTAGTITATVQLNAARLYLAVGGENVAIDNNNPQAAAAVAVSSTLSTSRQRSYRFEVWNAGYENARYSYVQSGVLQARYDGNYVEVNAAAGPGVWINGSKIIGPRQTLGTADVNGIITVLRNHGLIN